MSILGNKRSKRESDRSAAVATPNADGRPDLRISRYFARKPWVDRLLAGLLLVPALPIIGVLGILVRLTSRGPAWYRQKRVGKNGVVFTMYKLRSMRIDAEARSGAVWSTDDDHRVTPLGRLLRKFHLDELPQLFNVLRGDMSLVGPRPERPEFVHVLSESIPGYGGRLAIVPGVTGLAQLNLPADTDLDSVCRKLALDLEYAERASLLLDLRVIACTACRCTKLGGYRWLRFFGLRRDVEDHPYYARIPGLPRGDAGGSLTPAELAASAEKGNGNGEDTSSADGEPGRASADGSSPLNKPR